MKAKLRISYYYYIRDNSMNLFKGPFLLRHRYRVEYRETGKETNYYHCTTMQLAWEEAKRSNGEVFDNQTGLLLWKVGMGIPDGVIPRQTPLFAWHR